MSAGVKINWTAYRLRFIRENWQSMTAGEMAGHLGISKSAVRGKRYELGLRRFEVYYWTRREIRYLRKHYRTMGDVEIAQKLSKKRYSTKDRWSHKHVRKKRLYLNLHRTPAQIEAIRLKNIRMGCYSRNHWRRWEGRSAPIGDIRVWLSEKRTPYKVIKTCDGYVHYARWLYRQTYGAIPRGKMVTTRDGNPMNIVPENLELITKTQISRLLIRSDRYIASRMAMGLGMQVDHDLKRELLKHPELIAIKRKQLQLEKEINERT